MTQPIVVFDSGVGGLSVLRELVRQMPCERFIYFGDSKNAPYGTKSTEQIRRLTLLNIALLAREEFKAAVIACNTATSAAIEQLREEYPQVPIIGIEPALKPAFDRHPNGKIVVMATETTLREEKFAKLAAHYNRSCKIVSLPAPELVEFVERGILDGEAVEQTLRRLLRGCEDANAVVLGCTHFPFLRPVIQRLLPHTEVLDGSEGTARETMRRLAAAGCLRVSGAGSVELRSSLDTPQMRQLCERLLGEQPNGGACDE